MTHADRENPLDTPWGLKDLSAVAESLPDGIVLPKVARKKETNAGDSDECASTGVSSWLRRRGRPPRTERRARRRCPPGPTSGSRLGTLACFFEY